jgi:hypothetical protein
MSASITVSLSRCTLTSCAQLAVLVRIGWNLYSRLEQAVNLDSSRLSMPITIGPEFVVSVLWHPSILTSVTVV